MIVQHVLKGIGDLTLGDAKHILENGISCNWWRKVGILPESEVKHRLTARNLHWHQNNYDQPDPLEGNEPFGLHTPFISTTAGTIERDPSRRRHVVHSALEVALSFATDNWQRDGYVYYCYLFVLGRPNVRHRAFSEELRELNVYTSFSPFQPEGEITAKILIPSAQIEKLEVYRLKDVRDALKAGRLPTPSESVSNPHFISPQHVINERGYLS